MNADDKLRAILQARAAEVDPGAEGFDRIREGIAQRRRRTAWLRGSLAAASALSLAAVAVLVVRPAGDDGIEPGGTPTPTISEAPSATPDTSALLGTVWPFTTQAEVDAWEAAPGNNAVFVAPDKVTARFAELYLGVEDAVVTAGKTSDEYLVSRTAEGVDTPIPVTTVHLRRIGADGPWAVVSATSDAMEIGTPAVEAAVTSPVNAAGSYQAVDPAFTVQLRSAPDESLETRTLASTRAATSPSGWAADLVFEATGRSGSLVVTNASLVDGGIGQAAVVPVRFADEPAPSATPSGIVRAELPPTFVAIEDGRVAVFDSRTGERVRFLTEQRPGGGVSSVSVNPNGTAVAYAEGAGTCAGGISSLSLKGGEPVELVAADDGVADSPALLDDGSLAWFQHLCAQGGGDVELRVKRPERPVARVKLDGSPRAIAWTGRRVAVVLDRNGETELRFYDPDDLTAPTVVAPDSGCDWYAVTWRPTGGAAEALAAELCPPGTDGKQYAVLVSVTENGQETRRLLTFENLVVAHLDYDQAGRYLLIQYGGASVTGAIEMWAGSGRPEPLAQGPNRPSWS